MNGQIEWGELFFSAQGRAGRNQTVIAALSLLALTAVYEAVVGSTLHLITGFFVYPAVIYCGVCVLSKRLHDRGRSGWWAAPILAALVGCWPHPDGFLDFPLALVLVWAIIELGVLHGEAGANRFGPSPIRIAAPL